jgi:DNA-binding transcriptional ArsR family regulator
MVEQVYNLDSLFGSLSDTTRRDIIRRVSTQDLTISSIAKNYKFSFAAIAKHLNVLEKSGLVKKTRKGKEQIITIDPIALATANNYLDNYKNLWESRLDSLNDYLNTLN